MMADVSSVTESLGIALHYLTEARVGNLDANFDRGDYERHL